MSVRVVSLVGCGLLAAVLIGACGQAEHESGLGASTPVTAPTMATNPDGSRVLVAPPPFDSPSTSDEQVLTLTGSTSEPATLDPALLRDASSAFLARQVFRGLIRLDEQLLPQPDLAERVEISADGLTYMFVLRQDATFQDGEPIDAQAVVESFNRACDPQLADGNGMALPAALYLGDIQGTADRLAGRADTISGISAEDSRTIRIVLQRPAADFLFKLAGPPGWVVDVATAQGSEWWRDPNGSGAFRLASVDADGSIVLTGWDEFWAGAPALERIDIRGGADAFQPMNLYEADAIDVTSVPLYSIDRVLSPSDALHADLVTVPQLSTTFIVLNPNIAPYNDPQIRRAIGLSFERAKIATVMFDGKVTTAAGLVPPGIMDRDWPSELPEHDVAAGEQILKAAGDGFVRPRLFEPGGAIGSALRQVLIRDLALDMDVIDTDWPSFAEMLTAGDLDAYVLTWIADYPDPSNFLTAMFHSSSPDNYLGYSNPSVDRLLDAGAVEADPVQRAELYLDAQQLIIDDGVLIPLYHDTEYSLVKPWVHGLTISPVGILSLEDVWIDRSGD